MSVPPSQPASQPAAWTKCLLLLIPLAFGAAVRFVGLGAYYFSPDDVMHLLIAGADSPVELWKQSLWLNHPPLIYLVLRMLLLFGSAELFLRSVSLVPGLLFIGAMYVLCGRRLGVAAGLTAALLAAFSYGLVLQSQVLRGYSLALLLIAAALHFFLRWHESQRGGALIGYLLCMLLALSAHWFSWIPAGAVGLFWLGRVLFVERTLQSWLLIVGTHLPFSAVGVYFYQYHLRRMFNRLPSEWHYLRGSTADSLPEFPGRIYDLFGYLFFPPLAVAAIAAAVLGLPLLWRRSPAMAQLSVLVFFLSAAAAWGGFYPLGGSRHSLYLFPFAALPIAALAGGLYDGLLRWLESSELRRAAVCSTLLVLYCGAGLYFTTRYRASDYLRRYNSAAYKEFPLTRRQFDGIFAHLREQMGPRDAVFTNVQSLQYFRYLAASRPSRISRTLRTVGGWDCPVYAMGWKIWRLKNLQSGLTELSNLKLLDSEGRLWLVNLGWFDQLQPELMSVRRRRKLLFAVRNSGPHFAYGLAAENLPKLLQSD